MLVRLLLLLVLLSSCQSLRTTQLREGDILFQNLDCGDLCRAIESVTYGRDSLDFSHMGLYFEQGDGGYLLESIGPGVIMTPIDSFLARSTHPHYVGRLSRSKHDAIPQAIKYGREQLGVPYDNAFLYKNNKYYCSELLYDCFTLGAGDSSIFHLEPMTFQSKQDSSIAQIWQEYYEKLSEKVPEGQLGINPAGMSRSKSLKWLKILKN